MPGNGPRLGSVADVTDARTAIKLGFFSQKSDLELAIGAVGAKFIQRVAKEFEAFSDLQPSEEYYFMNLIFPLTRRRVF